MLSIFLFNLQARHYKESLFCFRWLKMRPRYWMQWVCSLFNCFQVWQSLPSESHRDSLTGLLKCHFFREKISLFITASPLLSSFLLCLIFPHTGTYYIMLYVYSSIICPHPCPQERELQENGDLVSFVQFLCPTPTPLGKVPGTEKALNVHCLHEWEIFWSFVKTSPLYSCSVQCISYN